MTKSRYLHRLVLAFQILVLFGTCSSSSALDFPPKKISWPFEKKKSNEVVVVEDAGPVIPAMKAGPDLEKVWEKQQVWGELANKKKKTLDRWREGKKMLLIASVVIPTLSSMNDPASFVSNQLVTKVPIVSKISSIPLLGSALQSRSVLTKISNHGNSACIGAVALINGFCIEKEEVSEHVKFRCLSQHIKSEVFKFRALKLTDEEKLSETVKQLEDRFVRGNFALRAQYRRMEDQEFKRKPIPSPPSLSTKALQDWYTKTRVDDQIKYFSKNVKKQANKYERLKWMNKITSFVTGVSSAVPFLKDAMIKKENTLSIAMTGAVTANEINDSSNRSQDIFMKYWDTQEALEKLEEKRSKLKFADYVNKAEQILMEENKFWEKNMQQSAPSILDGTGMDKQD